jgi:predicted CXXCH cytochrome family protein
MIQRTPRWLWCAALAWLLTAFSPLEAQRPKPHPRLADLATTRCQNCHGDLVENMASVHPPAADDCTICHTMTLGETATTVELVDQEPGLCVFCHDDKETAAAGELPSPHFPVTDSCLTCHSPHGSESPRLLFAAVPELCLTCHLVEDLQEKHGNQITEATNCVLCHMPHGSETQRLLAGKRLHPPFAEGSCEACHRAPFGNRVRFRSRGEKLCTACHGDKMDPAPEGGSFHPALNGERGRPGCVSCHSPHMSDRPRLLLKSSPTLCGDCHPPILAAAKAPSGHYPAGEDCLTCHQPHKAPQRKLLDESPPDLCLMCHDPEELQTIHMGRDPSDFVCTRCHTPHGSGNPKLLAENVHPPILDGCDICHETLSYDEQLEGGESALCLLCHDDIGELADNAPFPHFALEVGRCADCHNPHASPQEHLVKSPGAGPCVECHDDKLPEAGEKLHGVIELVGCRACHEPHGGERERLLRKKPPELCLSCHAPGGITIDEEAQEAILLDRFKVPSEEIRKIVTLRLSADGQREHPVANHRTLGAPTEDELNRIDTTFQEGELTCLSCHNPHKGRYKLLNWNASSAVTACKQCHPK